jgi:hypothetical protein
MVLQELCPELVIETTIKHAHIPAKLCAGHDAGSDKQ